MVLPVISLDAWSTSQLQNAAALLTLSQQMGAQSIDEVVSAINQAVQNRLGFCVCPSSLMCPVCGKRMHITAVNVSRCTRITGKWKSLIQCGFCDYEQLSALTPNELLRGDQS